MGSIILLGLVAGLGTCLGALLVIACGSLRPGAVSLMLGLASGIMVAVILCDLLPSSLEYGNPLMALKGFLGGTLLMAALDLLLNLLSPAARPGRDYLKMGYLIALGIALHDLPEGFAIAAGFAAAEKLGPILVIAIGLHNIPEGMATAAPLRYGLQRNTGADQSGYPLGTFIGLVLGKFRTLSVYFYLPQREPTSCWENWPRNHAGQRPGPPGHAGRFPFNLKPWFYCLRQ